MDCSHKQKGYIGSTEASCTLADIDEEEPEDFSTAWDKVQKSNKSFATELSSGLSLPADHLAHSVNTSRLLTLDLDPHPIISEGWKALRKSLVTFRGQPVGTIAALDNSHEKLNYDQVT